MLPVVGLLQTIIQYFFFYMGLAHTSGVKASIIEAVNVFIAILIAGLLFHQEKITSRKIVGCILGFAGIGLLIYLALVSAVAYSVWGILLKYNPVSRYIVNSVKKY